jgi:hypothetical protein
MPSGSPSRATSDQRSPAFGERHHRTTGLVPSGVKVRQLQDGLKIDTTCSAWRPGRIGADRRAHPRPPAMCGCIAPQIGGLVCCRIRSLAWANAGLAVRYGSVSWHAVEINIDVQEDLSRPSMRTRGAEVVRGRWCRSMIARSPTEPLEVGGVAVLACCTVSGSAGEAMGLELPIFRPGVSPVAG